jgi:hypothetical protein
MRNHKSVFARTLNAVDLNEWNYRVTERLGIMCGTDEPTPEQLTLAQEEADDALRELTKP